MTHISPPGKKNNRSILLSLENNYRHAIGGAKTPTIKNLKSVYDICSDFYIRNSEYELTCIRISVCLR